MGPLRSRETARMKRLRVCENLVSKRVDDGREGSKPGSDPWRPAVRASPCSWLEQGWPGGNPTIKAAQCLHCALRQQPARPHRRGELLVVGLDEKD